MKDEEKEIQNGMALLKLLSYNLILYNVTNSSR